MSFFSFVLSFPWCAFLARDLLGLSDLPTDFPGSLRVHKVRKSLVLWTFLGILVGNLSLFTKLCSRHLVRNFGAPSTPSQPCEVMRFLLSLI